MVRLYHFLNTNLCAATSALDCLLVTQTPFSTEAHNSLKEELVHLLAKEMQKHSCLEVCDIYLTYLLIYFIMV